MPWIRFDCSTLDDDFAIELSGDEFKAWALFLLRVKAVGARGSVKTTSLSGLSRNWNVPESAIFSMLEKTGDKITEEGGRWHIRNWKRYQEDYRDSKGASPEKTEDATNGTTLHHTTRQDTTPQKEKDSLHVTATSEKELEGKDFILRCDAAELQLFISHVKSLICSHNAHRTGGAFIWKPTTGSLEADLRSLIYKVPDETKKSYLWAAYKDLDEKLNWPNYVVKGIQAMLRASIKQPIHKPYGFVLHLLKTPQSIISEMADGSLSGALSKIKPHKASEPCQ